VPAGRCRASEPTQLLLLLLLQLLLLLLLLQLLLLVFRHERYNCRCLTVQLQASNSLP
jgi:hypothetical protein